jgi:NADH-quinone oxidoreductase subunit I
MGAYFTDLKDAILSTMKGMTVTMKHFLSKPVTVHYPDEKLPISDAFLGKHKLTQENCIACNQCVKACPVDCLAYESDRHPGKVVEFHNFLVDYNYCMFCGLCVDACGSDALHMTKEYDLSVSDRKECKVELITWTGLRPEDLVTIEEAKKKKAAKAKAIKAEKEAKAEAAEAKEDKPAPAKGKAKDKKTEKDDPPAAKDGAKKEDDKE